MSEDRGAVTSGRNVDDIKVDLENRDPNDLNPHLRVFFEDVIGEPEGAHSRDCIWINAIKCFFAGRNCCYTCLTHVCAIPLAFCWGCEFAFVTFNHIWTITPCLYIFNINFSCLSRCYGTIVRCCCDPFYESMSLMFTKIFFNRIDAREGYKNQDITTLNLMRKKGAAGTNVHEI